MANRKFSNRRKSPREEDNYVPPFDAALLQEQIEMLGLSPEVTEKLHNGKVYTCLDVLKRTEQDFYRISTFNKKNLFELKNALRERKLFLKPLPPKPEKENSLAGNHNFDSGAEKQEGRKMARRENEKRSTADNNIPNNRDKNRLKCEQKPNLENKTDNKSQNKNKDIRVENKQRGRDNNKNNKTASGNVSNNGNKNNGTRNGNQKEFRNDPYMTEQKMKDEIQRKRPVKAVVPPVHDIYMKVNKNGKWGFQDRDGKEVVEPIYDEVFQYKEDLCCVESNEKFGFIDRRGEVIIPIEYECALSFSEGYACVYKNGLCGYINKKNEVVVDFKFEAGTAVIDGNCRVKSNAKWGELFVDNPNEIRWII